MSVSSLRSMLSFARRFAKLIRVERSLKYRGHWRWRVAYWRRGFVSQAPVLYNLNGPDESQDYVSDFTRYMYGDRINSDNSLLGNKLACHFLIESVLGNVNPRLFATVKDGRVYPVDCPERDVVNALIDYLSSEGALIVKPIVGAHGRGVQLIEEPAELRAWINRTGRGLICERVEQHPYADAIFPGALNTIRLVTMVDDNGPFIAATVHRFGGVDSAPVDNWSSGGYCAQIALDTGELGKIVRHPKHTGWKMRWYKSHPDTDAAVEGVRVPQWQMIVDSVLDFAWKIRFLPYLAWDIAVTEKGLRVVEINGNSDVDLLQIHGPLLRNERVRAFYKSFGVIPQ